MNPELICRALAAPSRFKAYAAIALGAHTPDDVAAATGLTAREVVRALATLTERGMVEQRDGVLTVDLTAFGAAVREHVTAPEKRTPLDPDPERDAVLRVFIAEGKLLRIPVAAGKRRVVLEYLAACFEPGVRYPERAVNAVLRGWHPDYASLRRYLIDEDLLGREHGVYWRTGGPVDV